MASTRSLRSSRPVMRAPVKSVMSSAVAYTPPAPEKMDGLTRGSGASPAWNSPYGRR